jgi:hypothetical protein
MEKAASEIRILINGMPPEELLGYIYSQLMIVNTTISSQQNSNLFNDTKVEMQFLLEYVHAVLASDIAPSVIKFEEKDCDKLFTLCKNLRNQAMLFAMISSANTDNKDFGSNTPEIEFHAKSCWVMIRGNRYQVLEGEFYQYVLTPHDDILREIYGVGALEIAEGFQELANATLKGTANAIEEMMRQFHAKSCWVMITITSYHNPTRFCVEFYFRGIGTEVFIISICRRYHSKQHSLIP